MASQMSVPFLGRIPLDPTLSRAAEEGRSACADESSSLPALSAIIRTLMAACGDFEERPEQNGTASLKPAADVSIDPLLSSRIHLGF